MMQAWSRKGVGGYFQRIWVPTFGAKQISHPKKLELLDSCHEQTQLEE